MRAFYVINRIPASILRNKIPLKIATNKTGNIIINLIPFYSPVLYIMLLIRMRELLKIIRDIHGSIKLYYRMLTSSRIDMTNMVKLIMPFEYLVLRKRLLFVMM
jgi:hypothetical protein